VLGAALLWLATRRGGLKVPGQMVGLFWPAMAPRACSSRGSARPIAQFITPDNPFGHVIRFGTNAEAWGLTMGQLLSLPMLILGLLIIVVARWRAARPRPA
jgi:phosphatidylglycerol:prolipoprotein diacylglycerol transferase